MISFFVSHRILLNDVGWTSVPLGGFGGMFPHKKKYILRLNPQSGAF